MTTLALAVAPSRARSNSLGYQLALALVGSWLIAGLAQLSIHLPFTPVPITGQTLGILLVAASLGPAFGALSVALYLGQALLGVPVLAPNGDGSHDVGLAVLGSAAATGGYLWGFLVASAIVGNLARQGWDRSLQGSIGMFFVGELVIFAIGIPWLMRAVDVELEEALALGLYPFVVGDAIKLLLAAVLLPAAWRLTRRAGGDPG
jgi:biotin transport system substrate-specific component